MNEYFRQRVAASFDAEPIPTFQELHGDFPVSGESADDISLVLGKSWHQVTDADWEYYTPKQQDLILEWIDYLGETFAPLYIT